jgi:argininosuccinate lyase
MTVAHYLLAVADLTARAIQGMELAYGFMNRNSLGTGALAGTHAVINRQRISELMGFPELVENAYDAVSAADHFSTTASLAAGLAANLSRIAQDFSIWSMAEFDFAYVGDEFAATSSMMPQKRNSVCWEFIRARAAKVVGASMDVLTMIHNTTFADVCDTCIEVAEPAWRALDTATGTVRLLGDAITSVRFNGEKMFDLVESGFSSVSELAELIQRKSGQPYRVVHRLTGQIVSAMIDQGKTAREIDNRIVASVAKRTGFPPVELTDGEVKKALDPWEFVAAHNSPGGTAPKEGRRMLVERVQRLEEMGRAQKKRHRCIKEAEDGLDEILHSIVREGKEVS